MIARVWRGKVRADDLAEYRLYIVGTGLADYKATPGNQGAYMLTRVLGETAEVLTLSLWDSYRSIARFAGTDYNAARYYPEDARYLLDFPKTVEHYEVD